MQLGQSSESKSGASESLPSLTEISASLADDLNKGKDHSRSSHIVSMVENNTRKLIAEAKTFKFLEIDPFRIVGDIIAALRCEHFKTTHPLLRLLLAQALHLYVDFTVMRMFQEDAYKVHLQSKEKLLKDLVDVLKELRDLKGDIHTVEIQYSLLCAEAGILALKDSNSWRKESIEILKLLGTLVSGKNIGTGVATIEKLFRSRQKLWYIHVLELRTLTPLAQCSTQHLDRLRQFMADPEITGSSEWVVHYAVQDSLAQVVFSGVSYAIKQTAFSGNNSEQFLPCVLSLAKRALAPLYSDNHVFGNYRVVTALHQCTQHPERWLKQSAREFLAAPEFLAKNVNRPVAQDLRGLAAKSLLPLEFVCPEMPPSCSPSFPALEEAKGSSDSEPARQVRAGHTATVAGRHAEAVQCYLQALSALEKSAADNTPTAFGKVMYSLAGQARNVLNFVSSGKLFAKGIDPAAVLNAQIEQLWALEWYQAIYPLLLDCTGELEGSTVSSAKLRMCTTPLYQLLQQHQLTPALQAVNTLLSSQNAQPTDFTEQKSLWMEVRRNFQKLQQSLHQVKDCSRAQKDLQTHSRNTYQWLVQSVEHATKLLLDAPCGFSLMLLDAPSTLLGTTAKSVSFAILLNNDFYQHHPYFSSLARWLNFNVNALSGGLLRLESLLLQEGEHPWVGTPKTLSTRALREDPKIGLQFCAAMPLYANDAGKKLYEDYRRELQQRLEQPETAPGSLLPSASLDAPILETKDKSRESALEAKDKLGESTATLSAEMTGPTLETKDRSGESKEMEGAVTSFPTLLSLGGEPGERDKTESKEHVIAGVFVEDKQDSRGDEKSSLGTPRPVDDETGKDETVKSERVLSVLNPPPFVLCFHHRLAKAVAAEQAIHFGSLREKETKETQGLGQRCLTSLTLWCQTLVLYFKFMDSSGRLLQDVPAILKQARDQKLLAPAFVDELQAIWDLSHSFHLQEIIKTSGQQTQPHQQTHPHYQPDPQRLLDLEKLTLQSAWQVLGAWLTDCEPKKPKDNKKEYESKKSKNNKKKIVPLDPAIFAITSFRPRDPTKFSTEEKMDFVAKLTSLTEILCTQRHCDLTQHLQCYHQILPTFRAAYCEALEKSLSSATHAQEVLEALRCYPEAGRRPQEVFKKAAVAWDKVIFSELTQEVKSPDRSGSDKSVRLQWYTAEGKLEERILQPQIVAQILNSDGLCDHRKNPKQENPKKPLGQRLVIPLYESSPGDEKQHDSTKPTKPIAFCKFFPQFPGMQVQATAIEQQITGHGLQFIVAKLELPAKEGEAPQRIPVLISQPAGIDLQTLALQEEKDQKRPGASRSPLVLLQERLDSRSLTLKLLESLLCGHEDHQPANLAEQTFMHRPGQQRSRLVAIDSDHAFQDSVFHEERLFGALKNLKVNRKNILYCLKQMTDSLDAQAVDEFLALDPVEVSKQFVAAINLYENQTIKNKEGTDAGLFSRQEVIDLLKSKFKAQIKKKDECLLSNCFKPDALYEFILQFHALQLVLKQTKKKGKLPTPLELLKLFDREIAHCYDTVLKDKKLPTPTDRFAKVQDLNPQQEHKVTEQKLTDQETKITAQEQKEPAKLPLSFAPVSFWARPSQFNPTKASFVSKASSKQSLEEFLLTYSKDEKFTDFDEKIKHVLKQYGKGKENRYGIIAKLKTDLEKGNKEEFLYLCEQQGLSHLLEKILKKIDANKMIQNLGKEQARNLQKEILEALVKHKHRFYELHLNHWLGLTDDLLYNLASHSKHLLQIVNVSHCDQLSHAGIASLAEQCQNLVALKVSHNNKLSGKTVRIVAEKCRKLKRLDLSHLTNLHTIRQVEGVRRIFDSTSGPLFFESLEHLQLDGCLNLNTFNVFIPQLKTISFTPCEDKDLIQLFRAMAQEGSNRVKPEFLGRGLMKAVKSGYTFVVRILLNAKVPADIRDVDSVLGYTALMWSAHQGHVRTVRALLEARASAEATDEKGNTPWAIAAMQGHVSVIQELIEAYKSPFGDEQTKTYVLSKVHAENKDGWTALMLAAKHDHVPVVEFLLEVNASFDATYYGHGRTALIRAAKRCDTLAVQVLLEARANVNKADDYNHSTPLIEAAKQGDEPTVQALLKAKPRVDMKDRYSCTALMGAVQQGHVSIVQILLEAKANVKIQHDNGETPLTWARKKSHIQITALLEEAAPQLRL